MQCSIRIHHEGPASAAWVEASSAAFQLADPTVVSEYAAVRCTEFTSIAVLTSFTASIGCAVGVMFSDAVSFEPFGAVMV